MRSLKGKSDGDGGVAEGNGNLGNNEAGEN